MGEDARPASRRMWGPAFSDRILVCDGAMGTMLHSAGLPLDRSLCELNVAEPRLVRDLHSAYLAAGANIVQTNTFDANRLRLARVGLEDRVVEINIAGARLAREAVRDCSSPAMVAGSVGPVMSAAAPRIPRGDRGPVLREQIAALVDWVDLIMLETFGDIESLVQAVEVALDECDLPVIAQMTFGDDGRTLRGEDPAEVAAMMAPLDVAAVGANCTVGPAVLQDVVAQLAAACALPVTVQPNAGMPRRLGRQLRYAHNTEYFADAARQFAANGATIIGGCCGTTPAHIRAIARSVTGLKPHRRPTGPPAGSSHRVTHAGPPRPDRRPPVVWPHSGRFVIAAGMRAPRGQDVPEFVAQAKQLMSAGADLLAITDPDPPAARVNPIAAAVVLRDRVGADVMVQMETADRSLAALEADLLGAHALGVQTVSCRSGIPRVAGDYPDPYSLWDVDSVRLIAALSGLNEGVDWRGVTTPDRTRFVIGASLHLSAMDVGQELARIEEKVRAGAHFLLTDVVHDVGNALTVLAELRTRGVELPVIAALAPFDDVRAIARLIHEIPDVSHSSSAPASSRSIRAGPAEPVDTTLETAEKLRDLISGILVYVPPRPDDRMESLLTGLGQLRRPS
jgi:methionine synthase / methylenetetrahydrofolate reductase(NADPH)